MDQRTLLEECRGQMTKRVFAETLEISYRMLTAIYAGERNPGRAVMIGLLHAFPEKRDLILHVFLPTDEHECASDSTDMLVVVQEDVA